MKKVVGSHFMLELSGSPCSLLNDPDFVSQAIVAAVEHAELTLLNQISHAFEPQGVTAVGLLAESHLSIHTWPENRYAAVDLFTCGDKEAAERACRFLIRTFEASSHTIRIISRGAVLPRSLARPSRVKRAAVTSI